MALNAKVLRDWVFEERSQTYTDRDTMLYALSLGFGSDPLDQDELRFVYEKDLVAVPSMPVILCHLGAWIGDPRTGATRSKVVHGEQRVRLHRPLSPTGRLVSRARVLGVQDKGADKGALIHVERAMSDADTGELVATVINTSFCRADGGFEGSFGPNLHLRALPERLADFTLQFPIRQDAALLYRLNVDRNPLHVDPDTASRAGFQRPILHGLCTYGMATRAILTGVLGYRADHIRDIDCRFSSAIYPGETLQIEVWSKPDGAAFRGSVIERGNTVIDNGWISIQDYIGL